LLDATSHQLHVPHAQIVEHRVEERFFTRLDVAACLLPQNAEDVDHLLGRAQVALESVRHRVRDLTQVEEGLRAEPEHEGRERDRFIGALGGGRGAFGGRRLGQRGRGRLLGGVGARLSAVGEPAAVPHLEPASLLLVLGHGNAAGAGQYAIARSLRMRSSMGGWVLNKPASQLPRSGFTIQRCAVAGPAGSGTRPETAPIFSSAAASECGAWASWAPLASARYSRAREMASWISIAAGGATMIITRASSPLLPSSPSSRRKPPNSIAHCAILATIITAPASVAAMALVRVSRFRTCESSCASTPRSSSRVRRRSMPRVAATA